VKLGRGCSQGQADFKAEVPVHLESDIQRSPRLRQTNATNDTSGIKPFPLEESFDDKHH